MIYIPERTKTKKVNYSTKLLEYRQYIYTPTAEIKDAPPCKTTVRWNILGLGGHKASVNVSYDLQDLSVS